ncbi:MAG TPA: hypothetical protein VK832_12955, partial [Burkholderiaceae bacterium]|nr:hypothetical protein [Burkholderiaceae bacterium]
CRALLSAVTSRIGECRVEEGKLIWIFFSPAIDSRMWRRQWPATTKATKVQRDIDQVTRDVIGIALRTREWYQAKLAEIDRLLADASEFVK